MKTKMQRRPHTKGVILNKDEEINKGLDIWVGLWRKNIHRFIEDYFECNYLKLFQKIILYLMNYNVHFVYIASRGQGKSFLVAMYCCAMATLYPKIEIVVSAGSKIQAKLLVQEKIQKFATEFPNLGNEIKDIKVNSFEAKVTFKNGSTITCATPSDNSRGILMPSM